MYGAVGLGQCGMKILDQLYMNLKGEKTFLDFFKQDPSVFITPVCVTSGFTDYYRACPNLRKAFKLDPVVGIGIDGSCVAPALGKTDQTDFEGRVKGGMGATPWKGHILLEEHQNEFLAEFRRFLHLKMGENGPPVILMAYGAGGGTGSGTAPKIAEFLKLIYPNTPIIAVAVLPAEESEGYMRAWNAVWNITKMLDLVDGIIVVDNQVVLERGHGAFIEKIPVFNEMVVDSLKNLVLDLIVSIQDSTGKLNLPAFDIADYIRALAYMPGKPGIASIGRSQMFLSFSETMFPFLSKDKTPEVADEAMKCWSKQLMTGLEETLPVSAAMVFKVNKKYLNKVYFETITKDQEDRLTRKELHHGVVPTDNPEISVTTSFTYRPQDVGRLKELEVKGNAWARKTLREAKNTSPEEAQALFDNVTEMEFFSGG